MENLRVTILTDNPDSWIVPWADRLASSVPAARRIYKHSDIGCGDVLVALGCERIISSDQLAKHRSNVVVHSSPLPYGRGFSPVAWQILAGQTVIPVVLFEATAEVDAGPIYLVGKINLNGAELNGEIKAAQGRVTVELVRRYLDRFPMNGTPQSLKPVTWFRRRTPDDSELDVDKSIREQFNLLRIVDNDRYPAFFDLNGARYRLRIECDDPKA